MFLGVMLFIHIYEAEISTIDNKVACLFPNFIFVDGWRIYIPIMISITGYIICAHSIDKNSKKNIFEAGDGSFLFKSVRFIFCFFLFCFSFFTLFFGVFFLILSKAEPTGDWIEVALLIVGLFLYAMDTSGFIDFGGDDTKLFCRALTLISVAIPLISKISTISIKEKYTEATLLLIFSLIIVSVVVFCLVLYFFKRKGS